MKAWYEMRRAFLPYVSDGAYLLFHDSLFIEVARGIDDFVTQNRHQLVDFGTLTREITVQDQDGRPMQWGGMRLVQVRRETRVS